MGQATHKREISVVGVKRKSLFFLFGVSCLFFFLGVSRVWKKKNSKMYGTRLAFFFDK